MVVSEIAGVKIAGIAAAVSNKWTPLTDFSDEEDEAVIRKFIKKTGVEGRYDAGINQTTSDFCFAAAKALLKEKKVKPEEVGVLILVTQTADYAIPATACVLQTRLGLDKNCIAFDVNLGCSGFTYGLNIAGSLLNNANSKYALLLAGDTSAKERSQKRRLKTSHSASMLFGDSGTATLLEKSSDANPIKMISRTDGSGYKAIISPYGAWRNPDVPSGGQGGANMDDVAVFNFTVSEVPEILKEAMKLEGTNPESYDCLVLHQANLFIMKQIAKRSGFDMKKTLLSLDKFGNTSSSSVPITMVKQYGEDKSQKDIRALMCGFGVGLSWSTVDCHVNLADIMPLIHTNEYFEDGYSKE